MPFLIRSNLISFVLDFLFNLGLGFFCLFHFRIPPEQHGYALTLLAALWTPRTLLFFVYRIYHMMPIHRWLQAGEGADDDTVKAAARASYEVSLRSNIFYTFTFIALYALFTHQLWVSPRVDLVPQALVAGAFMSVAVGLGAFALGYPLNIVVNSANSNKLSLLLRQKGQTVDSRMVPLRARVLVIAFCLTGTPCCMMLSVHAMYQRTVGEENAQSMGALGLMCLLLFCWALLSALLLNLTISRPVERVKALVDEIFAGTAPQQVNRVPVSYPDELGVLAEGTNRMLDQLQASGEQLDDQLHQLEHTNDSLRQATRVKGEFLASMSHELRTPLNAIIGFSKILLRKTKTTLTDRQYRNLEQINKSGNQLLSLVNDILDFEKIEAGRVNINPEEVRCDEVRDRILETFTSTAEAEGLAVRVEVVNGPLVLWTDPDRLFQILTNFIVNAIKYAGSGTISVRFERVDGEIRCSVTDQGPGISEEEQRQIFSAFQQLADGKSGVGLGLAIVTRLANLMGGRVELDSTLGEGSTFTLVLPGNREIGEMGLERLRPTGDGSEILVVDDQPDFLELMHGELTEAGYRVHLARSGEMALEMLKSLEPSAILLDIVMPGIGGWETLRQIRSDPRTKHLPVVISSVMDDTPVGFDLDIKGWLTKPVASDDLRSLLAHLKPGRKVLIVDDDEATTEMLGQVLDDMDVKHLCANSGESALETLRHSQEVGAVILDLGLPDIDGFEVLDRLRALPEGDKIAVVAYTGRDLSPSESQRLNGSLARVVQKHASNSVAKVIKAVT